MGPLDGRKLVSQFSIPGTHNSGALHEPLQGSSQCQNLTIAEQLEAGVRYLDIRCRHVANAFAIYHGPISQYLTFDEVLATCLTFLADNPSECIAMSVMEESTPVGNNRAFDATYVSYVAEHPQLWVLGATIPTLDRARGKIVMLRRFSANSLPIGIDGTQWPVNATFTIDGPAKLRVQDEYLVPDNLAKLSAVENFLDEAAAAEADVLYLNYTSGYKSGLLGLPNIRTVSDFINPAVLRYFTAHKRGRYGISVMDFADSYTCAIIIATN
jgi:1-phosphatidylinositol phosphodiesterase